MTRQGQKEETKTRHKERKKKDKTKRKPKNTLWSVAQVPWFVEDKMR